MVTEPSITELAGQHRDHLIEAVILRDLTRQLQRIPPCEQPAKPETFWEKFWREHKDIYYAMDHK